MAAAGAVALAAGSGAEANEPPAWSGYAEPGLVTDASYRAPSAVSADAAVTSGAVRTATYNALNDAYARLGVRPAADPSGEGYSCWFYLSRPYGYYTSKGELYARVEADVNCNFESPKISYLVEFQGNDPASGSFVRTGPTATCTFVTYCREGIAYYYTSRTCTGSVDHWGVAYGHFQAPDGTSHPIVGYGVQGPHSTGTSYSRSC